jgi:1,4-alpha-glucan branching enzyme
MQRVMEARKDLSSSVVHSVPVVWSGLASEVRLMGEFDNWGEGFLLSSDSIDDHVFQRFKANVPLLPGRYRVKFSVDGEWRLASDWPTENTPEGDTNNILVVDPQQ